MSPESHTQKYHDGKATGQTIMAILFDHLQS